jgi:hypothetical protein
MCRWDFFFHTFRILPESIYTGKYSCTVLWFLFCSPLRFLVSVVACFSTPPPQKKCSLFLVSQVSGLSLSSCLLLGDSPIIAEIFGNVLVLVFPKNATLENP